MMALFLGMLVGLAIVIIFIAPKERLRLRRARNLAGRAEGFGGCLRCGDTWDWKGSHDTPYGEGEACFPLCSECWAALTPEERMPYYDQLVDLWILGAKPSERVLLYNAVLRPSAEMEKKRKQIRAAVREGR